MKERYDLLIIGAGPGGYVAAIENEGIGEALEELSGGAIHVMPKKRR